MCLMSSTNHCFGCRDDYRRSKGQDALGTLFSECGGTLHGDH